MWIYTWPLNNTSSNWVGPLLGGYFNKYVLRYWTAVIGWIHGCGIPDTPLNVQVRVAQSCPTLWNPMECTVHGILQARILEWVAFPFSTGSSQPRSPALPADSSPAEPQGKPKKLERVAYPFSSGSSWPRNWTRVSCIAGRFFTNWAVREALRL